MKTPELSITGETLHHKMAAIFDTEGGAEQAAANLRENTSLNDYQLFLIGPNDTHPGWELEPEDRGIWKTLVRSHVWLGLAGLGVGLLVFFLLFGLDIRFVVENALTAAALAAAFGVVFGMLFAGLITIRPDHMPYVSMAQSALRKGKYVVAVHAASLDQLQEADSELQKLNVKTIRTL
jgi:hypothetical protein